MSADLDDSETETSVLNGLYEFDGIIPALDNFREESPSLDQVNSRLLREKQGFVIPKSSDPGLLNANKSWWN